MKRRSMAWATPVVACSLTLACEASGVNHYSAERLHASDETTVTAPALRFAAQADGIVKTGAGTASVDVGGLVSQEKVNVAVHAGTLRLNASTPFAPSSEPPAVITSKATLWLQAGVNAIAPTNGLTGVEWWYDVREPAETQQPTGVTGKYPMARSIGVKNLSTQETTYQHPEVQQIQTANGMRDALYFHGASASWMRFYTADRKGETALKCFHTFAVVFPKNTWGYLYGTMSSTVPLFAEPGNTSPALLATGAYFNLSGTLNIASSRFYVNGELTYPGTSVQNILQVQEFEFDHRHAVWECLYRNGANGRYGGDWLGEVITFERHLSAEERLAVSDYLRAKWVGASFSSAFVLDVAADAAAEVGTDGAMTIRGEGEVRHTGNGTLEVLPMKGEEDGLTFAQTGSGAVCAEVGAMRVRPTAGEKVTVARNNYDVQVLTTDPAAADDRVEVAGSGSVILETMPSDARVLSVSAGELVLGSQVQSARTVTTGEVYATIVNGDAEQRFIANPNAGSEDRFASASNPLVTGVLDSWHYETAGGFSILKVANEIGTWKFNLNATDDKDRFAAVQGKGCVTLKAQTTAWTEMTIPADGDYEFSYFATARRGGYDAGFLGVSILDTEGETVQGICRHPILLAEGWRPYRYLVRGVKAGTYRLQLVLDCQGGDKSVHVDDLTMRLVAGAADSARRCAVPNGGFNWTSGAIANAGTFCKDNLPDGWTLTQGPVGSTVTTYKESMNLDVAMSMRWHRPYDNSVAPAGSFYNPSGRFGEAQLNFRSNGGYADSAEFTVPAGRWKVRVNASRWTFRAGADVVGDTAYNYLSTKWNDLYGNQNLMPTCGASVFVNGTETNLGSTPNISSYQMEDYTIATAFSVSEGDKVKIRLRQNTAPDASGPAMMALNEVWLERDEDAEEANLVKNGSFEQGDPSNPYYGVTNWTLEKHTELSSGSNAHRYDPHNPTQQGTTRCTGSWALLLVDAASAKQDVTFPRAGAYRLRFKSRARFMDLSGTVDNATYGGNRVRAWLQDAAGNAQTILQTADIYSTNFVAHAAVFTVPAAGTYTVNLNGCNLYPSAPTGRTAKSSRVVYIDDVEIIPLEANDVVAPNLAKDLAVELAAGTKLRLDYVGVKEIGSLKVGKRRYSGVIDASHPSGLIAGPGALYAEPRGTILLVR